jgi:tyrosinase
MEWNRREFLATSGALATVLATGGCEKILKQIANRPLRRNIANLAPNSVELATYRDGVAAMKALPASDPRSWNAQALIHQNFCPHSNWFFLPWHRGYLLSFERIIQKLTGNAQFGLPFWNWQTSNGMPAPFWVPGSPLLHSPRTATSASSADTSIVGAGNIESILDESNFEVFASYAATALRGGGGTAGRLEGEAHNYIHGFVGGTMGSYMSPLDPIFWCHHNILDYQWFNWNAARNNPNTNDPVWANFDLAGMFVDGDGNPVSYRVGLTPLMPLLSYRFESDTIGESASPEFDGDKAEKADTRESKLKAFLEKGAPVRFRERARQRVSTGTILRPGRPMSLPIQLPQAPLAATLAARPTERTFLRLSDAMPPDSESYFLRLFVDRPEADATTPIEDPAYAGSIAFFSDRKVMPMGADFQIEISHVLRARAGRNLGATASLTFVPVPMEAGRPIGAEPFTVGSIDIVTSSFDPEPAAR